MEALVVLVPVIFLHLSEIDGLNEIRYLFARVNVLVDVHDDVAAGLCLHALALSRLSSLCARRVPTADVINVLVLRRVNSVGHDR